MLSHFYEVNQLLVNAEEALLLADRDSGFRSAIPAVFVDKIAKNKLHAFQLATQHRGGKDILSEDTKVALAKRLKELKKQYADKTMERIKVRLWGSPIIGSIVGEPARTEWVINPWSNARIAAVMPLSMSPAACIANPVLLQALPNASLSGVDNWFQILRRRLNMLERPVTSATNGRRWNAYAGYNPTWMTKLIEIMRIYYNYCSSNEKELHKIGDYETLPSTPATRIGIASEVYAVESILSFSGHIAFHER
ncbi:MAG: hypothetical protein V7784_13325 [Oceanospirillaceae bacterium]